VTAANQAIRTLPQEPPCWMKAWGLDCDLDQRAFQWNHWNAQKLIDFKE